MLNTDQIQSFCDLWLQEYGEKISSEEACRFGIELVGLVELLTHKRHNHEAERN